MNSLFIETSAVTAIGVREAFREVVEKILDTPELWVPDQHAGANDGSIPDNISLSSKERQSRWGCGC